MLWLQWRILTSVKTRVCVEEREFYVGHTKKNKIRNFNVNIFRRTKMTIIMFTTIFCLIIRYFLKSGIDLPMSTLCLDFDSVIYLHISFDSISDFLLEDQNILIAIFNAAERTDFSL